jgi:hypothetical protein
MQIGPPMRHSKIAVALAASALMIAPLLASTSATAAPVSPQTLTTIYNNPNAGYIASTCLVSLAAIPDFTPVNSVSGCGQTVGFSLMLDKRSVPASWPIWGIPPQAETASPHTLYMTGAVSLIVKFLTPRRIAGVEAQPAAAGVHPFKAVYYDINATIIGTVARNINGNASKLLAAKTQATTKVAFIVITSDVNFSIAQIRIKP